MHSGNEPQPQPEAVQRTLSIKVIAYASAIIIICLFLAITAANLILTKGELQEIRRNETHSSLTHRDKTSSLREPSRNSLSSFLSLAIFNISAILLTVGVIAYLVRFMMRAMGMDFQQVKILLNSLAEGEPLERELPTPRLRETAEVYPAISNIQKSIDKKRQLLEHQELRDKLTGLSNRRQFNIEFARAYDFARRGTPVCVVLMHLDGLSKLNENQISQVVKILGKTLKEHARRVDHAARMDLADFSLLMFGASPEGTTPCLERICQSFHKYQIEHPAIPEKCQCTLNCGYTRIHAHRDKNAAEVLKRAEEALLEAKHSPNRHIVNT
jgi:diguanylate cyclase (GGDEF)-like protein